MTEIKNTLPKPFSSMLENYNLNNKNIPLGRKSRHWDVFPDDYEESIT